MRNDLYLSKIKTNVPGFDDLFHGGLRLPDIRKDKHMDGICIVIYGKRGVSKSDLAMQIMRGVDRYFKMNPDNPVRMTPRFCSLNHRESEWEKHYRGAEIVELLDIIKAPEDALDVETHCNLCSCFKELVQLRREFSSTSNDSVDGCGYEQINNCPICKLIRHGVIVYNSRSLSLHWNVGSMSDEDNFLSFMSEEAIDTTGIFNESEEGADGGLYEKTPLQVLNDMREEVYAAVDKLEHSNEKNRYFHWSSCAIESFTDFSDDDLKRLPYSDLIRKLRKAAAVSILVFDERGADLHLNADIIIHMTKSVDPKTSYQFQEMHIVKSDCQPHVQGWHKYRTVYGMKIIVYPSIPYLLMTRYEMDNAVVRLEHESLLYPEWRLQNFQSEFVRDNQDGRTEERVRKILSGLLSGNLRKGMPYDDNNSTTVVNVVETEKEYDILFTQINQQVQRGDTTVVVFLLGGIEQEFRKYVKGRISSADALSCIHCWEATSAYIWPEFFASVVKRYISRWKRCSTHHHLHILIEDLAKIRLYPLMSSEPLLPYALANICRNATIHRGFEGNNRGVHITLSMVCTSNKNTYYRTLCQLKENSYHNNQQTSSI